MKRAVVIALCLVASNAQASEESRNFRFLGYEGHGVAFLNKGTGKMTHCSFGGLNDARTSGFYAGFEAGCKEALTEEFGPAR